jgi:Enoyl-(Acyl carrier protein) reductase
MVETEGVHAADITKSDFRKQVEAQTPLGRIGQPEDIAGAAVFLASPSFRLDYRGNLRHRRWSSLIGLEKTSKENCARVLHRQTLVRMGLGSCHSLAVWHFGHRQILRRKNAAQVSRTQMPSIATPVSSVVHVLPADVGSARANVPANLPARQNARAWRTVRCCLPSPCASER